MRAPEQRVSPAEVVGDVEAGDHPGDVFPWLNPSSAPRPGCREARTVRSSFAPTALAAIVFRSTRASNRMPVQSGTCQAGLTGDVPPTT